MTLNLINKFEIHYFFTDDSHTMDAFVRNKCEAEALAMVNEILLFDSTLQIETEPYLNGGLKQVWNLIGKNNNQIGVILAILAITISIWPKSNAKLDSLQEENLNLEIEKNKIELKQLKESNKNPSVTNDKIIIDIGLKVIASNLKVVKHRSNFYSYLNSYPKVIQIATSILDNNYQEVDPPKIIRKNDFDKFIMDSDDLPLKIDENATIAIISPVLKKGKYKWKGLYNNQSIEFYMKDDKFKESIIKQEITFKNGVSIDCILEINRKINELGHEQIVNYNLITVLAVKEGDDSFETMQGKDYKKKKEAEKLQLQLQFK